MFPYFCLNTLWYRRKGIGENPTNPFDVGTHLYRLHIRFADGLDDKIKLRSIWYIGVENMEMWMLFRASERHDFRGGASLCRGESNFIVVYTTRIINW